MTGLKQTKTLSINELSLLTAVPVEAAEETVEVMVAAEEMAVVMVEVEKPVVSAHVQTQMLVAMDRFSQMLMEMPVLNILEITQTLGVETTTLRTSTQTQCAALVVVAIVVIVDLIKATKMVKEAEMKETINRMEKDSAKTQTTA